MKQEILRYDNGNIQCIINTNNSGQLHGLYIGYKSDGSVWFTGNWTNGKRFGLNTYYGYKQGYYL